MKDVNLKQAWGGFCLFVASVTGFFGAYYLLGCFWAIIQIKKGHDYGDALGLGEMFAVCLLVVALYFWILGRSLVKKAEAEDSKEKKS